MTRHSAFSSRDRGVKRDLWDRNIRRNVPAIRGLGRLCMTMRMAVRVRRNRFLCEMIHAARCGVYPTAKQLTLINDLLEKRGVHRVSCPVRLGGPSKNPIYRMRQEEKQQACDAVNEMWANKPEPIKRIKSEPEE